LGAAKYHIVLHVVLYPLFYIRNKNKKQLKDETLHDLIHPKNAKIRSTLRQICAVFGTIDARLCYTLIPQDGIICAALAQNYIILSHSFHNFILALIEALGLTMTKDKEIRR
jgi:hypothetical protein